MSHMIGIIRKLKKKKKMEFETELKFQFFKVEGMVLARTQQ